MKARKLVIAFGPPDCITQQKERHTQKQTDAPNDVNTVAIYKEPVTHDNQTGSHGLGKTEDSHVANRDWKGNVYMGQKYAQY